MNGVELCCERVMGWGGCARSGGPSSVRRTTSFGTLVAAFSAAFKAWALPTLIRSLGSSYVSPPSARLSPRQVNDLEYGAQDFYGLIEEMRIWKVGRRSGEQGR